MREDWPICIQLLAKRAFCKDVLLASSGDRMQLPTSTQTKGPAVLSYHRKPNIHSIFLVVSRILRCVQEQSGVSGIYQASVTWKLGLLDPHPTTDQLSPIHPEEPFIEDVGELIAAPNPSSVELRSFSGKVWSTCLLHE